MALERFDEKIEASEFSPLSRKEEKVAAIYWEMGRYARDILLERGENLRWKDIQSYDELSIDISGAEIFIDRWDNVVESVKASKQKFCREDVRGIVCELGLAQGDMANKELLEIAKIGLTARNLLIRANLGWVTKFLTNGSGNGQKDDLIQDARVVIVERTVEQYEFWRGIRFSTFMTKALGWEKRHTASLSRKAYIHIPQNVNDEIYKMEQAEEALYQETGRCA